MVKLDKESDEYLLFSKYLTLEQLNLLKRGHEGLRELGVTQVSLEILSEGRNPT